MELSRLLAILPLVLSAQLASPTPALAQDADEEMAGDGEEFSEDAMLDAWSSNRISRGDIDSLARLLTMTPEQKESALDLFAAYDTAMKTAYKKLAEVQKSVQGDGEDYDPEAWAKLEPVFEKYNTHTEKLRSTFLEDLQLTLTDEQKSLWPKFERRMRRKETMQSLMASGSRVDLIVLTEQTMKGEVWSPDLSHMLDEYEVEVDAALTDAAKWREDREKEWKEAAKDFAKMSDEERMEYSQKMMQDGVKRSRSVRDVNLKYLKRIGDQLPESKRFGFEDQFYSQSFWALSTFSMGARGTSAQRALEAIAGAKDIAITPEQQTKVDEIRRDYQTRRRAERDQQVARIIDAEDNPKEGERGGMFANFNIDPQEMAASWEKSREFEKSTIDKLRAIFTPEQLEKLPPPLKERATPDLNVDFDE